MSEHKYKAWDTNRREMVTEGGFIQVWGNGDYAVYHEDEAEWETTDHIIIDYTGLKDKNGVEGYHKDIAKDEVGLLWQIEWIKTDATFILLEIEQGHFTSRSLPMRHLSDMEIIGNIYEDKL